MWLMPWTGPIYNSPCFKKEILRILLFSPSEPLFLVSDYPLMIPLTYSLRFLLLATISSLALSFPLHSIVAIIASHYGDALS